VEFSSLEDDEKFLKAVAQTGNLEEAPRYVASYLWNERLFGMKTKRLGPTILASECVIPLEAAAGYIEKAKKLGAIFGVEIFVDSYIIDEKMALIMTNFLCDSRKTRYYIALPLQQMLTQTGQFPWAPNLTGWASGTRALLIIYTITKRNKNFLPTKSKLIRIIS